MPSNLHEALVELVRAEPEIVVGLAAQALRLDASAVSVTLGSEVVSSVEYRADCVLELRGAGDAIERVLVVEVQLRHDERKQWTWPVYQALLRARYCTPCDVIVITPDELTAARAREPVFLGHFSDSTFLPFVLGPEELGATRIPPAPHAATRWFLYALVAVRTRPEIVLEAPTALADVPDDVAEVYLDELFKSVLSDAVRTHLEQRMTEQERYQPSSWYYKKLVAKTEAERQAALAKAEAERQAALAKAEAERQAALTEARRTLVHVFEARGLSAHPAQLAVLDACDDLSTLLGWIARAVTATSMDEVFARAG